MVRLLGVGLLTAFALSPGASADQERLTKQAYLVVVEQAIDSLPHVDSMSADSRRGRQIEQFVDRLERLRPPADVEEIHRAWMSSLRDCALSILAGDDLQPCLDRHREICGRFYAKGYSFG